MPGRSHVPDLTERIVRTLRTGTLRTAGGLGSNASPGMTRDRVAAAARSAKATAPATARSSKRDVFAITGTGTSTFTLTYAPVLDSWNVSCSWDLDNADFTIVGKTLTIADPATVFIGASSTYPKTLLVQYDYLAAVPTAPTSFTPATFPRTATAGAQSAPSHVTFATAPAAGSSVLLAIHNRYGGSSASVTGLGATWTLIASATGGTGSLDTRTTELWLGTGCDGTNVQVTETGDDIYGMDLVEVTTPLTATGKQTDTSVNPDTTAGPLTASGDGVAAMVGLLQPGSTPTYTPSAGWTDVNTTYRFRVQPVTSGTAVEYVDAVAPNHFVLAVVKYA